MVSDEHDGGREPHSDDAGSAGLPTGLVWEWRARFFGALMAFAMIALDEPSRVVFCLGAAFMAAAFVAANAVTRIEVRVRRMKARRR